jgi:hypothetical protein
MKTVLHDNFSAIFGKTRGSSEAPYSPFTYSPNGLKQFCVVTSFEDGGCHFFCDRINEDEGGLDLTGLLHLSPVSDFLLEYFVEAEDEEAAREHVSYHTQNLGYDAFIEHVHTGFPPIVTS